MNRLYFGDNLGWLWNTKEFPGASVDLAKIEKALCGKKPFGKSIFVLVEF
jgi:hypothetical protein